MSKYCPNCGRQLPDEAVFCDSCGTRMPDPAGMSFSVQQKPQSVYYHCDSMAEAAEEAVARNPEDVWRYWSERSFMESEKAIRRFAEKEDRRLKNNPDRPHYVVSPGGAIGLYYQEEDGSLVLEWVYLTRRESEADLPDKVDDLR